jgi:hypothetical protein
MNVLSTGSLNHWRIAAAGAIVAGLVFGVVGLIWLILVPRGLHNEFAVIRLAYTTMIGVLIGCFLLLSLASIERGRLVRFMWLTILMTIVTAVSWLVFVWMFWNEGPGTVANNFRRLVFSLTVTTIAMVMAGQLLAMPTQRALLAMVRLIVAAWIAALVCLILSIIWGNWWVREGDMIPLGTTMLTVMTLVTVITLAKMIGAPGRQANRLHSESIPERAKLRLACPKCRVEQTLPGGLVKCTACGFAMLIEIEEPRCACGYLLYQLKGDMCPECGKTIPEQDRWRAERPSPVARRGGSST